MGTFRKSLKRFPKFVRKNAYDVARLPYEKFVKTLDYYGYHQLVGAEDSETYYEYDFTTSQFVNLVLCLRYPFLRPNHVFLNDLAWSEDRIFGFTVFDEIPQGWRYRYGLAFCEDLRTMIMSSKVKNYIQDYQILQSKEKYGTHRWYDNGVPDDIVDDFWIMIRLYEVLSSRICIDCGSIVNVRRTTGYILPLCSECLLRPLRNNMDWSKYVKEYNEEHGTDYTKAYQLPFEVQKVYLEKQAFAHSHRMSDIETILLDFKVNYGEGVDAILDWADCHGLHVGDIIKDMMKYENGIPAGEE